MNGKLNVGVQMWSVDDIWKKDPAGALRRLRALPSSAAARRIEGSLALADLLLAYCHQERLPALDASEQATALQTSSPEFEPDFQIIAQAALQNHFPADNTQQQQCNPMVEEVDV